jgi:asparagine synthase (glutamine-hydrolysing)
LELDGILAVVDLRLDNTQELRKALDLAEEPRGADGRLLIQAYSRWGSACADRLLGEFAFALWDGGRRRLFCARDGLGLKRIHYCRLGDRLLFATDAQQILRHAAVERRLNEKVFAQALVGELGEERETLFEGILRLPPGSFLVSDREGEIVRRFWAFDPERRLVLSSTSEYAESLAEILQRSVRDRLQDAGRVVASELSGGLDSSSIAALAGELLHAAGRELVGLSYISDRMLECDEREYSAAVANRWSIPAEQVRLENHWLGDDKTAFTPQLETPVMAWPSAQQALYRRGRDRGAHVILTGHGGDEMTTGSSLIYLDWLRCGDLRSILRSIRRERVAGGLSWAQLTRRRLVSPLLPSGPRRLWRSIRWRRVGRHPLRWLRKDFVARTGLMERLMVQQPYHAGPEAARRNLASRLLRHGSGSWMGYFSDLAAGPLSLEVRHPFLDRRLAEFSLSLPGEVLWGGGMKKALLRLAMADLLPQVVLQRWDKASFRAYTRRSLCRRGSAMLELLKGSSALATIGAIEPRVLRREIEHHCEGAEGEYRDIDVWIMLCCELWLRKHWVRHDEGASSQIPGGS